MKLDHGLGDCSTHHREERVKKLLLPLIDRKMSL